MQPVTTQRKGSGLGCFPKGLRRTVLVLTAAAAIYGVKERLAQVEKTESEKAALVMKLRPKYLLPDGRIDRSNLSTNLAVSRELLTFLADAHDLYGKIAAYAREQAAKKLTIEVADELVPQLASHDRQLSKMLRRPADWLANFSGRAVACGYDPYVHPEISTIVRMAGSEYYHKHWEEFQRELRGLAEAARKRQGSILRALNEIAGEDRPRP